MIQFYFLSILCNATAGYTLISDKEQRDDQRTAFRLVLGILTVITGLFKLLSVTPGDVPVVGDLIPALVGFAAGFILVFEYCRIISDANILLELLLLRNKKRIGFMAIGAAILHFLFPQALLI